MNEYSYSPDNIDYDPDLLPPYVGSDNRRRNQPEPRPAEEKRQGSSRRTSNDASAEAPAAQRRRPTTQARQSASTQRKTERKAVPFKEWGIVKFLCNPAFHSVIGVFIALVGGFIALTMISFLRHGAEDQSLVLSQTPSAVVNNGAEVGNIGGIIGAWLSHSLIVDGLGIGAVVAVVYFMLIGFALMGLKKMNFWSVTFKSLLVAITLSLVAGLVSLSLGLEFNYGGNHGRFINTLLIGYADWLGAGMISLLAVAAVFYVYINDILKVYNRLMEIRRARAERAALAAQEEAAAREKVRNAMSHNPLDDEEPADNATATNAAPLELGFDDDYEHNEPDDIYAKKPDEAQEEAVASDLVNPEEDDESPATPVEPVNPSMEVVAHEIEQADHITIDQPYDPTAELSHYKMPGFDLLRDVPLKTNCVDRNEQEENKERITSTLANYGIAISHIHATVGPTVTLYEIIPAEGVRIAKITRLEADIAMNLAALGIRIIAPIPGKGTIGIEVPNKDPQTVPIRSILTSRKFQETKCTLPMAMGVTISNDVFIADLCKMPHLLVAGATGMGKSVGLNAIIASLLYKKHPSELKFVLIDPKMVEFSLYSVLERHYLAKLPDEEDAVVTQMDKVLATLNSLCVEMDNRYLLLRDANVRSIKEYNDKFVQRRLNPEKGHRYLPYIVMIVDEFADLIMTAGKEVEKPIARIAQKARAVGMHMIIATQRPSTNVITGLIKANFPGRIAFRVQQMVDSRTILDRPGGEQLIGKGDMLFSNNGVIDRVQCAFIDTDEVQRICNHIDSQPGYDHAYLLPEPLAEGEVVSGTIADRDALFEEAAEKIVSSGLASTSSLQRHYSIGYNRAGKIMDQLEAAGIVGPSQGGKPRAVKVDMMQLQSILRSLE